MIYFLFYLFYVLSLFLFFLQQQQQQQQQHKDRQIIDLLPSFRCLVVVISQLLYGGNHNLTGFCQWKFLFLGLAHNVPSSAMIHFPLIWSLKGEGSKDQRKVVHSSPWDDIWRKVSFKKLHTYMDYKIKVYCLKPLKIWNGSVVATVYLGLSQVAQVVERKAKQNKNK